MIYTAGNLRDVKWNKLENILKSLKIELLKVNSDKTIVSQIMYFQRIIKFARDRENQRTRSMDNHLRLR